MLVTPWIGRWSIARYFPPGPEGPSYPFAAGWTGGPEKIPLWWDSNPGRSGEKRELYQLSYRAPISCSNVILFPTVGELSTRRMICDKNSDAFTFYGGVFFTMNEQEIGIAQKLFQLSHNIENSRII